MTDEQVKAAEMVIDLMVALKESLNGGHHIQAASMPYRLTKRVCTNCGCSEGAIKHFGWACDKPSKGLRYSQAQPAGHLREEEK